MVQRLDNDRVVQVGTRQTARRDQFHTDDVGDMPRTIHADVAELRQEFWPRLNTRRRHVIAVGGHTAPRVGIVAKRIHDPPQPIGQTVSIHVVRTQQTLQFADRIGRVGCRDSRNPARCFAREIDLVGYVQQEVGFLRPFVERSAAVVQPKGKLTSQVKRIVERRQGRRRQEVIRGRADGQRGRIAEQFQLSERRNAQVTRYLIEPIAARNTERHVPLQQRRVFRHAGEERHERHFRRTVSLTFR